MTNSSANSNTGAADLFYTLESNKLSEVEDTKKVFHDHFLSTKDNWLVNGLFDYYLSTDSLRAVEVLGGVREPHDKHLFDKLTETLAGKPANNGQKVQALTLLGHVARRHPPWLHKLASHTLFKQLLHLLKVEEDIVLLMSALLLLITLLPMVPPALTPHLHEIFEVFSRLASFHYHRFISIKSTNPATLSTSLLNFIDTSDADQLYLLHLQVGLHNLFHRLYAMYPCNFVSFLKQQYLQRDQIPIFKKIVSPMLDSVRMHPLLVTMSKESEISSTRWKNLEHHDVVAECGRFSLLERPSRDEAISLVNMRFTPISEYSYTPINSSEFPMVVENTDLHNGNQENFWSPSMMVSAQTPPPPNSQQQTPIAQHEAKSAPSTPGGSLVGAGSGGAGTVNNRSRTSPPEAAVEATPETTPVKDLRLSSRQMPVGSAAVRALTGFGNGLLLNSSRPSTPTSGSGGGSGGGVVVQLIGSSGLSGQEGSSILDRKLGKIVADRQSAALRQEQTSEQQINGRLDYSSWLQQHHQQKQQEIQRQIHQQQIQNQLEDQEVSDIVCSQKPTSYSNHDASRKVPLKYCCKYPTPPVPSSEESREKAKSCPAIAESEQHIGSIGVEGTFRPVKTSSTEDTSTQTCSLVPYEFFFFDVFEQRASTESSSTGHNTSGHLNNSDRESTRLSPSAMLERYIEVCARNGSHFDNKFRSKQTQRRSRGPDEESETGNNTVSSTQQHVGEDGGDFTGSCWGEMDRANPQIQLMLMQLQFERQRREVHAERNRRLLGKLRDSRALQELNSAMTNSFKLAENEIEALKSELSLSKMEARTAENKLVDTIHHWQNKCKEEQHRNTALKDRIEALEDELKIEKKKVTEHEKQTRAAEATLFEAAHQLKETIKTANQCDELKRVLETVQKRFLLLGEAQTRIQEKMAGPVHMARQEAAQIQRAWSEEISTLRRQLDSQTLLLESMKARIAEFEHKDARKEVQLVDQQRLLQESKERHSDELEALESKYKAQLEINLLLEARILELHGKLEQATSGSSAPVTAAGSMTMSNLASSASPKERSPPLSASLASSSEGSLAFIHSAMNDCDPAGEIANLQAIVEPATVVANVAATTSSSVALASMSKSTKSQQR